MTFRILFITDTHFRSQVPSNRTDDFLVSILKKFEYILDYAKEKKAIVIHGGDFFDSPRISDDVAFRVAKLIHKYKVHIYGIMGQHDIIGHNIDTSDRTKIGLFKFFKYYHPIGGKSIEIRDIILHGFDFNAENPIPKEIMITRKERKVNIAIVHALIAERNLIVDGKEKLIRWDSVTSNADLVLSGDYHPGYGIQHHDLTGTFCNPGSFSRMDVSEGKMGRKPMAVSITIKKCSISNLRLHIIPCILNPFDLAGVAIKITSEIQKDRFIKALGEMSDIKVAGDNVTEMLDNCDAPKTIIKRCKVKIKELRNE